MISLKVLILIKIDKQKMAILFSSVALLHTLQGYYSMGTPLGMAIITILSPFKFCN